MPLIKNKTLFTLLLLFISGINLSAAEVTFVNAMPIYLYGSVSSFAVVYEFINAVVTDTAVQIIFALGVTVQIFFAGLRSRTGDVADIAKSALAPITLYALFFVPTVNVHITDLRVDKGLINYSVPDGGYKKVDDVPYAIAFIPASSSLIVSIFIDMIDDNWNSVNLGNKFSTLGFQEMSRISQRALMLSQLEDINASTAVYNMNQYVRTCLIIEALKTPTNRQKLIHPSTTFPDMFDPDNFDGNVSDVQVTILNALNSYQTGTCAELYTSYVSGVTTEIEEGMEELLAKNFPNVNTTSADFNEAWREHSGVEQAVVGTIRSAMATTAASRGLERALSIEGIGVDGVTMATEITIESTIANLRTEGLAKFEWLSRMLPDALNIIMMIMLGAFPLAVMVMSFYGKDGINGMINFFMGYIAMNFNLVSLALVSNIISYYTAQNAQQAIVSYDGMPFGLTQVSDFMYQQADMAGLAGLIGTVSVFAVTPLIFKGEAAGFAAAVGAVGSAFRGNVGATAKDALVERDGQATIDAQALEAKNERDAAAWLNQEGYQRPPNMNAVEAQNQVMKNLSSIGSANAASEIFHAGNAQNFVKGSQAQSSQSMNKTAGIGDSVDMASAGSVAFEDGEVMGSMINNTRTDRDQAGFNAELVGSGQAHQQVAKDMGTQEIGKDSNALEKLTASSRMAANEQLASGEAMLNEGFDGDGFGALNQKAGNHLENVKTQAAEKFNSSAGRGSIVDYDKAVDKAFEDGARDGSAVNTASDNMFSGEKDKKGNLLYDGEAAAEGQAANEMAQHAKNMATAKAISEPLTGEQSGYADFINGNSAMARKSANDAIGIGEDWDELSEKEQISLMAKNKANSATGFRGSIEATNAELMKHGGVDGAINDMVTQAQKKGIDTAADSSKLRENYDTDNDGDIDDSRAVVSSEQKEEARTKLDANNARIKELSMSDASKQDIAEIDKLNEQNKTLNSTLSNNDSMTLSQQAQEISQSKIDSTLGQAVAIDANRVAGVNYAENAMYGEMSKQQSTQAKLAAQGGVDSAVGIDVMEAGQKASAQKGAVEGLQSEAQKIGEDIGKSAAKVMEDTAKTMASAKIATDATTIGEYNSSDDFVEAQKRDAIDKTTRSRIMDEMANNSDAKNNMIDEEKRQMEAIKGKQGLADYIEQGKAMGFLGEDGEASEDADDWVRGRATFSASGMNKNEQGIIAGTRVSTAFNALTGDAISNVDGVRKVEDGTSTNAHLGDSGNIESQKTREAYEHMMNPMSKGLPMLVGKSHDSAQEYFQSHGMSEEDAGTMASIITAGGAAVTAAGVVEAGTRIKNSVMGNKVATKSFEYDTGKTNTDGDAIMKTVEKGEHFSTKNNSALSDYVKNNNVSKVERGIPGKIVEKGLDTFNPSSNSKDTVFDKANDNGSNIQDDGTDSSGNNKADNQVQHNKTSNINSKDSIAQSGKTTKPSIPGSVTKKSPNLNAMSFPNPTILGETRPSLADPLTVPGTVKSGTVLDNQGFFEKRMSALSSVWGGGEKLKTKMAMSVGAMALGSTSVMASNMMDMVDPMAHISGTSLGDSSYGGDELKQMMARPRTSNTGNVPPSGMNGFQPLSVAPSYAQNAFSQPTGFNTNSAMRNAYNDNTSNINSTPQEYQKDAQTDMSRNLENIDLGTEFSQEASEGVREAVEQLSETIYKDNRGGE